MKTCCICNKKFEGWGNNPEGAGWKDENGELVFLEFEEEDCCCDECNIKYVLPGRLYILTHRNKDAERG